MSLTNCLKDNNSDNEDELDYHYNNIKNIKLDSIIINNNEELIFNPYNNNNKEIVTTNVQDLLAKYGIFTKPFNIELYKRAFVHKSYTKRPKLENIMSNVIIASKPDDCLPLKSKSKCTFLLTFLY